MSLLHSRSKPAIRGEVDLFSVPATDTTCDYSMYEEYQPLVNVQDSTNKIEFKIPGNGTHYLDLNDSFIRVTLKVSKRNGNNLEATSVMGTANLFLHSLFSQLDIYFNEKLVSTSNNGYAYRAYIETLLSYGSEYKNSQGGCALYYEDTAGGIADDTNSGWKQRKEHIAGSKKLELIDKLRFNLATQHRYILNDINVRICLTRSADSFALFTSTPAAAVAPEDAIIKLLSATFYIRKQIPFPSIILAHQRLLEKGEIAQYPFKNTEVKYFTIAQGSSSAVEENMFMNVIPSRIIVGFVDSQSFNGNIVSNPYKFHHYNIKNLSVNINNISMPIRPLTLDFTNDEFLLPYYLLFTSTGIAGQDTGLSFSRNDYKENNALFAFDIQQTTGNESLLHLEKSGSVKLEIQFATPLTASVNCVVLSEQQSVLEIDKYRQALISA